MPKLAQIAYSNSTCEDLWDVFQKQTLKHSKLDLCITADKELKDLGLSFSKIYSNDDPYWEVWVDAVNSFPYDYFIYMQEDFFLYEDINHDKIDEYLKYLDEHPEYSFVRLLKSGNLGNRKIHETLYEIESSNPNIFSMQASIWRSSDYIKLMETVRDAKWLENENYRKAMISLGMKGLYHYDNEELRGQNHYDSNVYPYIATALVRGQWNINEYPKELTPILLENNIDINKRGQI